MPLTIRCVIGKVSNSVFSEKQKDIIQAKWGMILQNYFHQSLKCLIFYNP